MDIEGKVRTYRHHESGEFIYSTKTASPGGVSTVMAGQHSEWFWLRSANGDLVLGVYPQEDTYFAVEAEVSF